MKKALYLFSILFTALWLNSCRDMPEIGDLAGQWQITEIIYPDSTVVKSPERYYCFYRSIAHLSAPGNVMITANNEYNHPEMTLVFQRECAKYMYDWGIIAGEGEDPMAKPFTEHYHISTLTAKRLEMKTGHGVIIKLKKY